MAYAEIKFDSCVPYIRGLYRGELKKFFRFDSTANTMLFTKFEFQFEKCLSIARINRSTVKQKNSSDQRANKAVPWIPFEKSSPFEVLHTKIKFERAENSLERHPKFSNFLILQKFDGRSHKLGESFFVKKENF